MRELILKDKWVSAGANFGTLGGAQCVADFGDVRRELNAIRTTAALCDFSFSKIFEYDESDGIDFLDTKLAANILKLRYGRIIDTFIADGGGRVAAEAFVANAADKVVAVCEPLSDAAVSPLADSAESDKTADRVLLSVDGPLAWRVARDVFGADILNLSVLSVEKYDFDGADVFLMRNGRTGEFGYQFLAPASVAESLCGKISESLESVGGTVCGFGAHAIARLEGNFFNVYAEGAKIGCPLELGLQWMVDFDKESFDGSEAIFAKRAAGVERALVGLKTSGALPAGAEIFDGSEKVGEVVVSAESPTLSANIGLGLFSKDYAVSGFDFSLSPDSPATVSTVSRPFVFAASLERGMEE